MKIFYITWALSAGLLVAIQASTNSSLRLQFDNPWASALINFGIGFTLLLLINLIFIPETQDNIKLLFRGEVPFWKILGGFMGVFFVTSTTVIAPKIGVGQTITLLLLGQITMSYIIDHFGLMGMPVDKISLSKALGLLLIIGGIFLSQK